MNIKIILMYLLRDIDPRHYTYQVEQSGDTQTVAWFYVAPMHNIDLPKTNQEIVEFLAPYESDAMSWHQEQKRITYDALFKLLPRTIRAQANALKDSLKLDTDSTNKHNGYMLEELLRDAAAGEVYNDGDSFMRGEFQDVRSLLVDGGILTVSQADTWANLEKVD